VIRTDLRDRLELQLRAFLGHQRLSLSSPAALLHSPRLSPLRLLSRDPKETVRAPPRLSQSNSERGLSRWAGYAAGLVDGANLADIVREVIRWIHAH
jgi:hypothetical protein